MNQDGIRYERSRHAMSEPDDIDRFNAAARKGRLIDRIFRAKCARFGIDPEAARLAGPLLALAAANEEKKTHQSSPEADCEASQI